LKDLWVAGEQCLFIDDKLNNCLQANTVWIKTVQAISPEQIIKDVNEFLEKIT
jgi:FMN phosphatase YigB (HAD superfamily)